MPQVSDRLYRQHHLNTAIDTANPIISSDANSTVNSKVPTPDNSPRSLYQVAYRSKLDNSIVKCSGYSTLATIAPLIEEFNLRHGGQYEYFAVPVNLNSLAEEELLKLVMEKKLTLNEASPYVRAVTLSQWYGLLK